ncbi:MAG: pilus assembly PilX N-terminal domain-containing protein, partial [Planctomycetota bacterium]
MGPIKKKTYRKRRAAALVASMIFVLIFSALAVSMATLSGANVQLASNHRHTNAALAAAQSGQEVIRYWLSRQLLSSSLPVTGYQGAIVQAVQDDFKRNSISNMVLNDAGSIAAVTLDSTSHLSFDASFQIDPSQPTILRSRVTGHSGNMARTITILYNIQPYEFPIFNFGLATKGPLNFPGNPTITAV